MLGPWPETVMKRFILVTDMIGLRNNCTIKEAHLGMGQGRLLDESNHGKHEMPRDVWRVFPQRFSWGENTYPKYFGGHHLNWCLDLNKWENPLRTHIPISLLPNLLRYEQVSVPQMGAYFLCPCISYHWWTLYSYPKQIVLPSVDFYWVFCHNDDFWAHRA